MSPTAISTITRVPNKHRPTRQQGAHRILLTILRRRLLLTGLRPRSNSMVSPSIIDHRTASEARNLQTVPVQLLADDTEDSRRSRTDAPGTRGSSGVMYIGVFLLLPGKPQEGLPSGQRPHRHRDDLVFAVRRGRTTGLEWWELQIQKKGVTTSGN